MLHEFEVDETAPAFSEQKWRNQRCSETIRDSVMTAGKGLKTFDNETAILENIQYGNNVSKLCFHPFENFLVVCDQQHSACVWNWEEGIKVNKFSNTQSANARISDLSIINEHNNPFICIASDDGVIRFWEGGFELNQQTKLVTAWRVLDDIIPLRGHSQGMVFEWQKQRDFIAASGNSEVIKIWDINKEIHFQDIPTESQFCVTSISMDNNNTNMIVIGCADGALKLFDVRTANKYAAISTLTEHKGWIVNNFFPQCLNQQLLSCSNQGDVKMWDLRNPGASLKTILAHDKPAVSSFSVHNYAPVFAIGTQDQRIRIMNFLGDEVSLIRYHDGFLGQRIGPVSDLTFHQYKLKLAAGATDSIVSIYAGEMSKDQLIPVDINLDFNIEQ
jgi:regulator-associated protein of mTOR